MWHLTPTTSGKELIGSAAKKNQYELISYKRSHTPGSIKKGINKKIKADAETQSYVDSKFNIDKMNAEVNSKKRLEDFVGKMRFILSDLTEYQQAVLTANLKEFLLVVKEERLDNYNDVKENFKGFFSRLGLT